MNCNITIASTMSSAKSISSFSSFNYLWLPRFKWTSLTWTPPSKQCAFSSCSQWGIHLLETPAKQSDAPPPSPSSDWPHHKMRFSTLDANHTFPFWISFRDKARYCNTDAHMQLYLFPMCPSLCSHPRVQRSLIISSSVSKIHDSSSLVPHAWICVVSDHRL